MAAKPTIDSGVPAINSVVNPVLSSFAPPQHVLTSANPLQIWIPILNIIWLIGVGALLFCIPQLVIGAYVVKWIPLFATRATFSRVRM